MHGTTFGTGSARSGAITLGISLVLAVETVAIHLFVAARLPWLAWLLTSLSVATLGWIAFDWRDMGRGGITLAEDVIALHVGRRWRGNVPRARIERAMAPEWRHIPEPGTDRAKEYANLTKPAEPNVMLVLDDVVELTGPAGIVRRARLLGLHVDEPVALLRALGAAEPERPARLVIPSRG